MSPFTQSPSPFNPSLQFRTTNGSHPQPSQMPQDSGPVVPVDDVRYPQPFQPFQPNPYAFPSAANTAPPSFPRPPSSQPLDFPQPIQSDLLDSNYAQPPVRLLENPDAPSFVAYEQYTVPPNGGVPFGMPSRNENSAVMERYPSVQTFEAAYPPPTQNGLYDSGPACYWTGR